MSKLSLYSISEEQLRINYMLEESGGEITPEIEDALSINHENFLTKADGYVATIQKYKDLSAAAASEIKRLQDFKKTSERIVDRMKDSLLSAMQAFDIDKVEVGLHKLSTRRTASVFIDDEAHLPSRFIIVSAAPDKKLIGEALKGGEDVPGASIQTNVSLQIK